MDPGQPAEDQKMLVSCRDWVASEEIDCSAVRKEPLIVIPYGLGCFARDAAAELNRVLKTRGSKLQSSGHQVTTRCGVASSYHAANMIAMHAALLGSLGTCMHVTSTSIHGMNSVLMHARVV